MSTLPFTSAGVALKQTQLYALSDKLLYLEAQAIASDLTSWLIGSFSLTAKQEGYLRDLPDLVRLQFGTMIAAAVSARGSIIMTTPMDYGPPRRTKKTTFEYTGGTSYTPPVSGTNSLDGTADLTISFELED